MESRTLGRNGPSVSRIGLGMAALGRPGYITLGHGKDLGVEVGEAAMENRAHSLLETAFSSSIRYFDVARSYGLGERFLGRWLTKRGLSTQEIVVGSKWGYRYTANWNIKAEVHEVKEHSLPMLKKQWGESVSLLNGYLKLYQIHSATLESGVLENYQVLEELAHLRDQGVRIGLSLTGPSQAQVLRTAMTTVLNGSPLFECVQATWNLLERSAGPALSEAHDAGMGVIIKEALANGRLTDRNHDSDFAQKLTLLKKESIKLDVSIDRLVLAATLAEPFADTVLSGATTQEQLLSNIMASHLTLNPDVRGRLLELVETPEEYWSTRKSLPWN
jgi:aryl-alcohol dehydrogenase-like predicted oxidoreductase